MANVFDINDWEAKPWFNTGGTRAKKYIERPDGKALYYFKQSEYKPEQNGKPEKNYKYEFWSEVIAYQVGRSLGFNVLEYNIALDNDIAGCICQDMIDVSRQELIGGVQYLQGYDPFFDPETKDGRKRYSFQLIEAALTKYSLHRFIPNIIEMVVFDTIIGNVDRHQENWAIISEQTPFKSLVTSFRNDPDFSEEEKKRFHDASLVTGKEAFAPLFDNGSSLGRELNDERVNEYLGNEEKLRSYIQKGKSEVHWEIQKISHYALLERLLNTVHGSLVLRCIARIKQLFDPGWVRETIFAVDKLLPDTHNGYRLPESRKELIVKLITLRVQKLFEFLG